MRKEITTIIKYEDENLIHFQLNEQVISLNYSINEFKGPEIVLFLHERSTNFDEIK